MRHDRSRAESVISGTPNEPSADELRHWMDRTCEGDAAALEALFRATHRWLVAIAYNYMRSAADAEDVVEEMFLKLWIRRDRIRVTGSVKSYLSVAIRNTALNHLDRRRVEAKYAESSHSEPWVGGATTDDLERAPIAPEDMERVRQAIDALPPRARETYCLYYHRGLTYAQIAQAMGVSIRTVEAQLVRCVRRLTKELRGVLD
jgi:RNA polymerase sigma-70 factor (ECF subfamily)